MHITQVAGQNFKGQDFARILGPMTVIVGDNFAGKTTIPDAIRLALTGYLPQIGKMPGATYGALAGKPDEPGSMEVAVRFDTGRESRLTFERSRKGACSIEGSVPTDLALNPMIVDVRTFFAMTGADRIGAIFAAAGNVKIEASTITEAIGTVQASPVKVRDLIVRKMTTEVGTAFAKPGVSAQAAIGALAANWTNEAKEARARHKVAAGAFAGMKIPTTIPARPENLAELRERRDALVGKRGELAGLLRAEASDGAVRGRLAAAESAVTLANEAMAKTPEAGPEPKRPELLDRYDAAQSDIAEADESMSEWTRKSESIRKTISDLEGVTVCPTCGGHADNSKILASHKTRLSEVEASAERMRITLDELREPFDEIGSVNASYQDERSDWDDAVKQRKEAAVNAQTKAKELADLKARATADAGDRTARIEVLKVEVEKLPEATLDVQIAEQHEQDANAYEKLLEDRETREREVLNEDCLATVYAESVKAVNKVVQDISERAFRTVLALSDDFTRGLLKSPLEFRDGELGRMEAGGWIPHTAFSGTEQLLAYAGFSVALARTAGFKLVVLDEMGRLSLGRRQDVAMRMEELLDAGKIDQAILIDATVPGTVRMLDGRDALDVYGENAVRIVL